MQECLQRRRKQAGFDVPTGNIHAPNENIILDNFFKGMIAAVHFYRSAADVRK